MKVVSVLWIDAVSSGDTWVPETEGTASVLSVGVLKVDNDNYITLVLSETEDGMYRGYISIPKGCIVESKVLYESSIDQT